MRCDGPAPCTFLWPARSRGAVLPYGRPNTSLIKLLYKIINSTLSVRTMARGGYNGGSSAVVGPKVDDVHIFTADRQLDSDLIRRSRIVEAGFSLKNEHGAVQSEFGYCLRVDSIATSTHSSRTGLAKKVLATFRRRNKADSKSTSQIKWVSASHLLHKAPGGSDLADTYYRDHPEAERPFAGPN